MKRVRSSVDREAEENSKKRKADDNSSKKELPKKELPKKEVKKKTIKYRPTTELEDAAVAEGYETICGLDECGRGPLAGPVAACAFVFLPGAKRPIELTGDSKALTARKRQRVYDKLVAMTSGAEAADAAAASAAGGDNSRSKVPTSISTDVPRWTCSSAM